MGIMASTALINLATVSVLVLMGASLYFLNYRPYRAAQLFPVVLHLLAEGFIFFVLSPKGQSILATHGFGPAAKP